MMIDTLLSQINKKQSPCVVGLDPVLERLPIHLVNGNSATEIANAFREFNFAIIDAVHDLIPAIKPQIAFYEIYGAAGMQAYIDTIEYARSKNLIVIGDAKRNDIASTAQAYADAHLSGGFDVDFLTVTPYLGRDGIEPFVKNCQAHNKGIFVLVKTSNPSSGDFQDRLVQITKEEGEQLRSLDITVKNNQTELYNLVALTLNQYAANTANKNTYSPIGAVVGATYPEQAKTLRKIMPNCFFLIPGFGAQGGDINGIMNCFNEDGYGGLINSSRGIIYAYEKIEDSSQFTQASREAVLAMNIQVKTALKNANKLPSSWQQAIN